jgi:glutathione S-transferase
VKSDTGEVTAISDSLKIAAYIERTFPDPERVLIPNGTLAFHAAFSQLCADKIFSRVGPVVLESFIDKLVSKDWYIRTRKELFEKAIEDIFAKGDEVETVLKNTEAGLDDLAKILDANNLGDTSSNNEKICARVMGEQFSYADIVLVGALQVIKLFAPMAWARLKVRNGGRWEILMESYKECLQASDV